MERNFQEFRLVGGETAFLDLSEITMFEPRGFDSVATLKCGKEVAVSDAMANLAGTFEEMRLHGIGQYKVNPDHVVAIFSHAVTGCRIQLSCGKWIESPDIAAADVRSAIVKREQYPWETAELKVGR